MEKRYGKLSILILSILATSSFFGVLAATGNAQQVSQRGAASVLGANWAFVNYDTHATSNNPQTLLSRSNINQLQMAWVYPFPTANLANEVASVPSTWTVEPGSSAPPLIVNGITYIVSNQGIVYAFNAKDGKGLWTNSISLNYTDALKNIPIFERQVAQGVDLWRKSSPVQHRHGINFWGGVIHVTGFACSLWGFDANTGDLAYKITNICVNVPGNPIGAYSATYTSHPPMYWNGLLLYVMGAYTNSGGRSFLVAYDWNAVKAAGKSGYDGTNPLWRVFLNPPNQGDPQWDYYNCDKGWVFSWPAFYKNGTLAIPCTAIPDAVKQAYGGDWGVPKVATSAVSHTWGQSVIDNDTGIIYFGTGEESPYNYVDPKIRPGLNIYGSSTIAVDLKTGKMLWWFQHNPHDLWDWDNSWSPILGQTNGQKAIFKSSKSGQLFSLNAATGKPNWAFDPPSVKWCDNCRLLDPTSLSDMTKPWPTYPNINQTWIQTPAFSGSLESDIAYDGKNIYGAWFNSAPPVYQMNPRTQTIFTVKTLPWPSNTTVYAIDANTGKVAWSHFYSGFPFRGGMSVTNGMLVIPGGDGRIHFLDTTNGNEIGTVYIGVGLYVVPTMGIDADGNFRLFQIFGGGRWGPSVPGGVMAFGLAAPPTPVTTTAVSTVQGPSTGIDPTTFYATAGVAVIFLVATGILAVRRRGP